MMDPFSIMPKYCAAYTNHESIDSIATIPIFRLRIFEGLLNCDALSGST